VIAEGSPERVAMPSRRFSTKVAGSFDAMKRDVRIRGESISLGQLLKLEGIVGSGAEVKAFLSTVPVWVNGEREARRGRKLHVEDVVQVDELELRLTSGDLDARRQVRREEGLT
jgi:ribosome-associated protein